MSVRIAQQLRALSPIDTTGDHCARLATVKLQVQTLLDEVRFANVTFGEGELSLDNGEV